MKLREFLTEWYKNHNAKANFALIKQIKNNKNFCYELDTYTNNDSMSIQQQLYHFIYNIKSPPKCPNCQKTLLFKSLSLGYPTYCSKSCKTIYEHKLGKFKEGHIKGSKKFKETYGINGNKHEELIRKREKTCIEKYGVSHPMKDPKIVYQYMTTCIKNYGETNPMKVDSIKNKVNSTNIKLYDHSRPLQNKIISKKMFEKYKQTIKNKYNVDSVFQVPAIFEKAQKNSFRYHKYKHLSYQASYEKDFIDYCEQLNILNEVSNGPFLWYEYKGKRKRYFSDFYIEKLNLIIEIKSKHWYIKYKKQNDTKRNACVNQGYNFIFIIDKDYVEFEKIIQNLNKL